MMNWTGGSCQRHGESRYSASKKQKAHFARARQTHYSANSVTLSAESVGNNARLSPNLKNITPDGNHLCAEKKISTSCSVENLEHNCERLLNNDDWLGLAKFKHKQKVDNELITDLTYVKVDDTHGLEAYAHSALHFSDTPDLLSPPEFVSSVIPDFNDEKDHHITSEHEHEQEKEFLYSISYTSSFIKSLTAGCYSKETNNKPFDTTAGDLTERDCYIDYQSSETSDATQHDYRAPPTMHEQDILSAAEREIDDDNHLDMSKSDIEMLGPHGTGVARVYIQSPVIHDADNLKSSIAEADSWEQEWLTFILGPRERVQPVL